MIDSTGEKPSDRSYVHASPAWSDARDDFEQLHDVAAQLATEP